MKKITLCILLLLYVFVVKSQNIIDNIEENYKFIPQNGSFLFANEFIELQKQDSNVLKRFFNNRVNDKPSLMDDFIESIREQYFFYCLKNNNEFQSVDKNMLHLKKLHINITSPNVDWGQVYIGCETCPFADFGPNYRIYVEFALIYMSENEIRQMIAFENGEQWGYMLDDIRFGDYFEGVSSTDPIRREIDRRIMQFLIDKWSPCQIPEVQELVKVLKESMPLEELANPVDVITGTWRGAFGNKTINFTIDYDASIAEAEKEYAKQTRWGMFTNCYFGVLGKSLFDGQPESKSVQSKGYYTDGGKAVQINLIEQPDTAQWNGEFNIWIDRKTNKMHGTWESNNKKLKRDFELEKVE